MFGEEARRFEESFGCIEGDEEFSIHKDGGGTKMATKKDFNIYESKVETKVGRRRRGNLSSLFLPNSKGRVVTPSSSRIPDQRSILCSIEAFSLLYLSKRRKETDLCTRQSIVRAWPWKTRGEEAFDPRLF